MGVDLAEARARVARGDQRAAIDGLKATFFRDTRLLNARIALSTLYRELGYPDQAGRWGYIIPGFTTEGERAAFHASLRGSGASTARLCDQMRVDRWSRLPDELSAVIAEIDADRRRDVRDSQAAGRAASAAVAGGVALGCGWLSSVLLAERPAVVMGLMAFGLGAFASASVVRGLADIAARRWAGWAWMAHASGLAVATVLSTATAIFAAKLS